MLHVDQRFVQLLAPRLHQFRTKSSTLFNLKCPFCESGTRDRKARGFIYEREGHLNFYCHRCGESMGLSRFLKRVDPGLHLEYVRERLLEGAALRPRPSEIEVPRVAPPTKRFARADVERDLVPLSRLDASHEAVMYAASRKLPPEWVSRLYYAPDFFAWARRVSPDKYGSARVESRLVIPFIGRDGEPVGYQGRALGKSDVKYVTLVTREDEPFLFNADGIDTGSVLIALEGPLDAMFLGNAVASGGGDVTRELARAGLDQSKVVVTYDNERRSQQTIKKMRLAIEKGWSVCVWPESLRHKDVNDMVASGVSPRQVREIIEKSARRGPEAIAALAVWQRC